MYVPFLIPVFIVQVTEVVQGYNKCSKIPPSTSLHFATRVKTWRVVSRECVVTFLYAGDSIQYVNEKFVSCIHFFSVHFTLHQTP